MAVPRMVVLGSFCLLVAFITSGISFFSPYWLGNVTSPRPGRDTQHIELDLTYVTLPKATGGKQRPSTYWWRGLWAQCYTECQWFWQHDYHLQSKKFTPLRWHLATQILYFIGVGLLLLCEVYARAQLCCMQRKSVYRTLGIILLVSFVLQVAAVATFGGFSHSDYGAAATASARYTYLGWCFWTAVAGTVLTALAAICFVGVDCFGCRRRTANKSADP